MKLRRMTMFAASVTVIAFPALAIDTSRPVTHRIGVLKSTPSRIEGVDPTVRKYLPRYLEQALTEAGFEVTMINRTIDEMKGGTDDDILIDVGFTEERDEPITSVGGGGSIEGVGVGGEVTVVKANAFVEIRVYNARTLEPLTSLELNGETTQPAFTGIGIGDPRGWITFRIPIAAKGPLKQVARNIAADAAAAMSEEFGSPSPR